MYKPEIYDEIIKIIIENGLESKISYTELYKKLCNTLSCKISHRDHALHLKYMLDVKILDKEDAGVRGSPVFILCQQRARKNMN